MMTRRETVIALLETLGDVMLAERDGGAAATKEDRVLQLSKLYHQGSYAELERCLALMPANYPKIYQHLVERYLRKQCRVIEVPYKRTAKGINPKLPPHTAQEGLPATIDGRIARVRVVQWSPWVKNQKVVRGVDLLTLWMRDPVQLPLDLLPDRAAA